MAEITGDDPLPLFGLRLPHIPRAPMYHARTFCETRIPSFCPYARLMPFGCSSKQANRFDSYL